MKTAWARQKGFTIVELLILIVVIGILAAITIVAYNGIQARANDTKIKSAANQIDKAIQLFYLDTGKPPYSGYGSTGTVSSNACPGSTKADGYVGSGIYTCTLEDLLVSNNHIPNTFISSLPPNKVYGATPKFLFMFYQCGVSSNNKYALFWYLNSPSSEDTSGFDNTRTLCGGMDISIRDVYGMRAGKIIQL